LKSDLSWPDELVARITEVIRNKAAIVKLFIVKDTLSGNLLSGDFAGADSSGAALAVATLVINTQKGWFLRRILLSQTDNTPDRNS